MLIYLDTFNYTFSDIQTICLVVRQFRPHISYRHFYSTINHVP